MSDNLGLGKIITSHQTRDAIHIAVAPVENRSTIVLKPGEHVGFNSEGQAVLQGVQTTGSVLSRLLTCMACLLCQSKKSFSGVYP